MFACKFLSVTWPTSKLCLLTITSGMEKSYSPDTFSVEQMLCVTVGRCLTRDSSEPVSPCCWRECWWVELLRNWEVQVWSYIEWNIFGHSPSAAVPAYAVSNVVIHVHRRDIVILCIYRLGVIVVKSSDSNCTLYLEANAFPCSLTVSSWTRNLNEERQFLEKK